MTAEPSEKHAEVLAHFNAQDVSEVSIYPYAPVFPCRIDGREAVVKRTRSQPETAAAIAGWTAGLAEAGVAVVSPLPTTVRNPVQVGEDFWVAYPFIEGGQYRAADGQARAAGELLGRIHAVRPAVLPPPFQWPDHDEESVEEDREGLAKVLAGPAPESVEPLSRLVGEFMSRVLPQIRSADLPKVGAVMDYKANNLIYTAEGPVLVDPDNADWAPRVLDLALAAIQFHIEHETSPARLFTASEWREFAEGYLSQVTLTEEERRLWPVAVEYMLSEYGVWSLIDSDGWDDPRERAYLTELAAITPDRFPLPG
ncbi:Ser/Thr protein kinase RdoA (MazF antagonist) [Stackebrandtia albiflava]|uniref:Ser/Thr protein kinase RdoA (MazF antagonist) n=1 Tax=Stackebrandtia albiflava TaxID=406432 RepID=A0A562VDL8_9ACTN|nr:phosphotransferase [Stackebrandtia albiflava]TWJ15979.1 Ser/Thr protein kinase RdoA (MazF antagonist) [Stackebrandtia albiflava]